MIFEKLFIFNCLSLRSAPICRVPFGLHLGFDVVGQVAEEIDASTLLEFVDGDIFGLASCSVGGPDAQCAVDAILDTQDGYIEVFGHNQSAGGMRHDVLVVYGGCLDYIERVAHIVCVPLVTQAHLQCVPYSTIVSLYLWLHIGEIERLAVLLART